MNRRIGIDVDLVFAASDEGWYHWLQKMCGGENEFKPFNVLKYQELRKKGEVDYNLASYFPEPKNKGVSPFDYWRSTDVYAMVSPVVGSVEALEEISKCYDLVFVSHIKGNSHKSKYHWLERHCPADFDFVATQEKYLVDGNIDYMIDDRYSNLYKFTKSKKIKLQTPYSEDAKYRVLSEKVIVAEDWASVLEIVCN